MAVDRCMYVSSGKIRVGVTGYPGSRVDSSDGAPPLLTQGARKHLSAMQECARKAPTGAVGCLIAATGDRQSGVEGTKGSVRGGPGGRRTMRRKQTNKSSRSENR